MIPDGLCPIDCDIHPALPGLGALLPYLEPYWQETIPQRGVHELEPISYPEHAPLSARPDWRPATGKPGSDLAAMRAHVLDPLRIQCAICSCLYGVHLLHSADMAAALARALNRWMAEAWLDRDQRLRASIAVPAQNAELAVEEIERSAPDRRFVQVLLFAMGASPLGQRQHWPIYAAAERHGLAVGIHAGSTYHHPVTSVGWPSYYTEDYAAQALGHQSQLTSLIAEGVFVKFPRLKVVLLESGFTWLPSFLWRLNKYWKGLKIEVPWLDRSPAEMVRESVRFSLQPVDAPEGGAELRRAIDHIGSDRLILFSTDYPHWQYDGDRVLPAGLDRDLIQKIAIDNPRATYARLTEA
jgi:hypothetical protein